MRSLPKIAAFIWIKSVMEIPPSPLVSPACPYIPASCCLPKSMDFYEPFSFISFDVKTPSSGVPHSDDALAQLLLHYLKLCTGRYTTPTYQPGPSAQLKAVVTDDTDISWLLEKVVPFCQGNLLPLVITPANGGSLVRVVRDRVTRCLEAFSSYPCVRIIPQVHPLLGLR